MVVCFTPNDSMESTETWPPARRRPAAPASFTPNDSMESTETDIHGNEVSVRHSFTPNDSMESTETAVLNIAILQCWRFTPNDSMESTETSAHASRGPRQHQFHPQRLDGEY